MAEPLVYDVDLSHHVQHLVRVTLHVPAELAAGARLVLPTWTPGSYVVRDYVHHVQQVQAVGPDEGGVTLARDGRTAWRLPDGQATPVDVTFELYANELTVRSNHVDDHHALLIGAATFPFVEGATDRPHRVHLHPPTGWRTWSLLPRDGDTYVADDHDHLVDSAFEAGDHPEVTYEVAGVTHTFVWSGHGGYPDLDQVADEGAALGRAAVELFGSLPVDRYTFLCVGSDQGGGGLEHRDGAVLMAPVRTWQAPPDRYRRFQSLVAHEYLHLWNVKRMTPAALVRPDLVEPAHTTSLWVAEGWTAYYDELLCLRAELWSVNDHLDALANAIRQLEQTPGRALQSVRQASHDAWTTYYVRDENSPNAGVSYYQLGSLLAWCLDLRIRRDAPDRDGLDDVIRLLWQRFGGRSAGRDRAGYTEQDVEDAVAEVAGAPLDDFFAAHVDGTLAPPLDELLEVVGLRWHEPDQDQPPPPWLGVVTDEDDQGVLITSVLRGDPAWQAGVTGGDRLLAIDGLRVGRGELDTALRAYAAGDTVELAVFRGPRLLVLPVTLGSPRPERTLRRVDDPTDAQRRAFEAWSGRPWDDGTDDEGDEEDDAGADEGAAAS